MQLHGSDPDIQTLIQRMRNGDVDLQPNFQRGEIWPITKKQKLIDSILREWHVPPIHLVEEKETKKQLVLDGQQRLVSIRDFSNDEFTINGKIEPQSAGINSIDGLKFSELPELWRRKFLQFTIRQFRITDYEPSEPGELFYRLNQPSALTSAEVRNAFFGQTREQVKGIIEEFQNNNLSDTYWGFSNARMSLDDVIARSLYLLDENSLLKKTGTAVLADKYRKGQAFSNESEVLIKAAGEVLRATKDTSVKYRPFNKATAQSWLVFTACVIRQFGTDNAHQAVPEFMNKFEETRSFVSFLGLPENSFQVLERSFSSKGVEALFQAYDDRAKSRVADTLSVALRDFVLWITFRSQFSLETPPQRSPNSNRNETLDKLIHQTTPLSSTRDIEELVSKIGWGANL